ncbi:MAG: primase-helicase family protein, partial [Armatimonadia bacterium]
MVSPASSVQYYLTDPDETITIAHDNHVKDNKPVTYSHTYRTFFESLTAPDYRITTKDGPGFMNGPCHGLRRKANIPYYHFAVLDGDSSLDEHGNRTEGAPSPVAIHTALKEFNLSHCIYTTFSHSFKGSRWRLLIPSQINSPAELRGLLTYLVEVLRVHCHLPVYLTQESTTWGNRWHFPRTAHDEAPFYAATHFGYSLAPAPLARLYGQLDELGNERHETIPPRKHEGTGGSLISQFCALYPLPELLIANGYTFHGQSIIADQNGCEMPVMRFRKPDSNSGPGVVVYWDEDRWRGYSHHKTDVMNTGHSFDAFDVFRYLGSKGSSDEEDWYVKAAEAVKDRMMDYMSEHHPVVLEGSKFKIGYLIDNPVGPGIEYRLMRWEDFNMKMDKRPGIFLNIKQRDGSMALKMVGLAEWWRKCKERVDYDGVVFEPTRLGDSYSRVIQKGETKFFNLFNGWNFKPEAGECDLLEWHLREALCSGIDQEYEYLLDWLAHLFQFPAEKPNVALVLRGGKGIGKSLVMAKLCASLGSLGLVIANTRQLTGDFNAHMRNKLLAVVEESFWAGSHTDEGPLKHLISDETTTFERKGVDAEPGRSFIRLVLITNNTWAVPASEDERRYFIPTVSNAAKDRQRLEGDYFSRLARELN